VAALGRPPAAAGSHATSATAAAVAAAVQSLDLTFVASWPTVKHGAGKAKLIRGVAHDMVSSEHIQAWRERLSGQVAFSASEVQDRLFDLYGDVQGTTAQADVQAWLLLTRQRDLFGADELAQLLNEIELDLEANTVEA
jgi:hypothetical protein